MWLLSVVYKTGQSTNRKISLLFYSTGIICHSFNLLLHQKSIQLQSQLHFQHNANSHKELSDKLDKLNTGSVSFLHTHSVLGAPAGTLYHTFFSKGNVFEWSQERNKITSLTLTLSPLLTHCFLAFCSIFLLIPPSLSKCLVHSR